MKLAAGLGVGGRQIGGKKDFHGSVQKIVDMEKAGLDVVTTGEAWSFDGFSKLAYIAAKTERVQLATSIINVFSRSATTIGVTAAGIDEMSDGRFILGLGSSGAQVVEGFWGVPFSKPLSRIEDVINVCRIVWRREKVVYSGKAVTIPVPKEQGMGLGKPLNVMDYPLRPDIPIWWAALTQNAVRKMAEIADGWIPIHLIPEKVNEVWGESLKAGFAKRGEGRFPFEINCGVNVAIGEDLDVPALRDRYRPHLALYVGGMGARGANFYNDMAVAFGFPDEAKIIQDLYLDGKKDEAAAHVPAEWLEKAQLIGPKSYVKERLAAYKEAGVNVLSISPLSEQDPVKTLEQMRELVDDL
ncbi:MAG: LLM class F420-dependent oxidoreductase [Frankiaceae bacterium]|jgi:F420-dependent oxidoreductase-like protein|nr:LLM class F420-dependent oxidoreductase [Frankiaceae bacterium]